MSDASSEIAAGTASDGSFRQHRFRRPPGACEILLVRHGETIPIIPGQEAKTLETGQGDPPLDPNGVWQAQRAADRLIESGEKISAIYVTTLQRTVETAAPLAGRLGIEPVVEPDLREVFLGEWENGWFRKHFAEGHPEALRSLREQRWDVIPGAENDEAFAERVNGAIARIAAAHPDQTVVVVCHGGVIMRICATAVQSPMSFAFSADNGSISHLVVNGDRWVLRRFNDTAHLTMVFTEVAEPVQ